MRGDAQNLLANLIAFPPCPQTRVTNLSDCVSAEALRGIVKKNLKVELDCSLLEQVVLEPQAR